MRRAVCIVAWTLGGALLLAVLLVAAVLVIGNTSAGRALIEREAARLTSGRLRIAGLGGTFPSAIDIARLELSDPQGVWMTAQRLSLRWSPRALIGWELRVERFEIGHVEIARKPVSTAAPSASRGTPARTSVPAIQIDRLAIDTLDLEPAAAGLEARLTVRGSMHYRSLEDARASLVAHRTNGRGNYAVQLRLDRSRMNARLNLEEPAGGPLEHLMNLPGLGAVSVDARLEGPRNAESIQLLASAGALRASAGGTVDLERRSADLTYAVSSPAMTPRPGLAWKRIALQGRWRGPLAAPQATGSLELDGLELPDGAQLAKLIATLNADGRLLTTHATADGITLPSGEPQLLQDSPLVVDAELRLDAAGRPLQLSVTHRLLVLRAHADTAGTRSATFDLRLPDVAPLAALYKEDIRGSLMLSGSVAQRGGAMGLDVNGSGRLDGTSIAARLLGTPARLHLAAALTDRAADLESLELSGRALSVSASGTAERTSPGASSRAARGSSSTVASAIRALRIRWKVSLPDLSVLARTVSGSLETTGTASGPLRSLTTDVRVQSRLSLQGAPPGTVEATLQARDVPSAPRGVLRASGTFDGAPLRVDASVEQASASAYRIVVRRTQWRSLLINGDLTADRNLAAGRGSLHLQIDHLADLQHFIGTPLEGSIVATMSLLPAGGRTRAQLNLIASHVKVHGVEGDGRLTASGPLDALRIELTARSADVGGERASLATAVRLDEPARTVDLDRFEAHYHGQVLHLLSPSRVMFANGITVNGLKLGAQHAVVAVDGEISPALDLRASVRHVDAALIDAFSPHLLAEGSFDAEARLTGSRSAPVGHASLQIAGLKLSAAQDLPAIEASGSARFHGTTADVSAQLHAGTGSRLTLSGHAPLDAAGTVALELTGRMDAALMNSILEARGERAAGTIDVDATVAGTAREPQIGGAIHLANGDVRDYAAGIHLQDIDARLVGGQGVLTLESMTARAGPGQLTAKGTIGVLQPRMPVNIELTARKIQPITNDILTANLDADMRVAGTMRERLDVTGTVHINRASISIPNAFPPSVAVLDVIRPGEAGKPSPSASRLIIGLDVTVDAPQAIFVEGRGLNAQLGGKLMVTGTSDNPQVSGGFSMIRGTLSLAGTNLNFTSGRVSFNGEGLKGRIDPSLDFVAQATVTSTTATTVTLHVTGFADAPQIALSSMPPLPEDDLLGLLLFGKPASQLTAIELAEVGGGLASLGGIGGGGGRGKSWNPLTWIRNTLGLNTFSVGGASQPAAGSAASGGTPTGGASFTAGKYISNKVYVAATQTTTGSSQVQVDVDLSTHLKLQTRLGNGTATAQGTTPENDPGSSIGIIYQFEF